MVVQLANIILRQAEKQPNGRQYLDDLVSSKFSNVNLQNGQITSTTVNGKSVTLQTPPGCSLPQIMAAAELALSALERGLQRVPRQTYAVLR